jgi:DNA-binding CsgD family transcriptional regulator
MTLRAVAAGVKAGVPSFLGLTVTVVLDGLEVTLTTLEPASRLAAQASLKLALPAGTAADPDTTVVFYAAHPGAFIDLAAMAGSTHRQRLGTDGHFTGRPAAHPPGVSGQTEISTYHQAVGALIDAGHTPGEATAALRARAEHTGAMLHDTARTVLDGITSPLPPTDPSVATGPTAGTTGVPAKQRNGVPGPDGPVAPNAGKRADLSPGERAVLRLLVAGYSTAAIAATLMLSPAEVRTRTQSTKTKLGTDTQVETVAITLAQDILGPP